MSRPFLCAYVLTCLMGGCAYYEDRSSTTPKEHPAVVSRMFHGDTRCSERTRIVFETACSTYRVVTDARARLYVTWDVNDKTLMGLINESLVVCTDALPAHIGGSVSGDIIRLPVTACPDEYACALHEIGHYLGLQHLKYGHGVMAERNPARSFSPGDYMELQRVGLYVFTSKDVTSVTVWVDPAIPRIDPKYPQ